VSQLSSLQHARALILQHERSGIVGQGYAVLILSLSCPYLVLILYLSCTYLVLISVLCHELLPKAIVTDHDSVNTVLTVQGQCAQHPFVFEDPSDVSFEKSWASCFSIAT
jgi:hypothetical protein